MSPENNTSTDSTNNNNIKRILKSQRQRALLLSLSVILGSVLIPHFSTTAIQYGYAMTDQPQIRTLLIKVQLAKDIVHQGETQTVRFHVVDEKSLVPIGGAITTATVRYADGVTTKQASEQTNEFGDSSISFRIGHNATLGTYTTFYSVFEAGYVRESGSGNSFSVIARLIALNQTNSDNTDTSSNFALPIAGNINGINSGNSFSLTSPPTEFNQTDGDNYGDTSDNNAQPNTDRVMNEFSTASDRSQVDTSDKYTQPNTDRVMNEFSTASDRNSN